MPDPLAPRTITSLDLDEPRLAEVAAAFAEIRTEIEKLRTLDLGEIHPAIVFHPVEPAGE
ncbi:hypothetical protein L1787_00540 [Acuticoccus sp. M5D2P5]|uniref:hypothetical protein n=1 Tax=Acuticoccus kalidii TaxID=2910977 RepID=UPI001F19FF75|nr:hypothetical protein [Acuticoccus kalidii]MCF3931897.1 hypothetical protein [Acuticoccus kalidii]